MLRWLKRAWLGYKYWSRLERNSLFQRNYLCVLTGLLEAPEGIYFKGISFVFENLVLWGKTSGGFPEGISFVSNKFWQWGTRYSDHKKGALLLLQNILCFF